MCECCGNCGIGSESLLRTSTAKASRRGHKIRAFHLFLALVWAPFSADLRLAAGPRRRAVARASLANDWGDAALRPSLFKAALEARERFADSLGWEWVWSPRESRFACSRVFSGTVPFTGDCSFTPARRALERPMAMACFVERAPCLPSPDVMHLLPYELASLGAGRLAFACIFLSTFDGFLFRHDFSLPGSG